MMGGPVTKLDSLFPGAVDRRGDPDEKNVHGSHLLPNGDLVVT